MRTLPALMCVVSAAALFGCGTAGPGPQPGPDPGPDYLVRTSVENVLDNIELAYEEMDAAGYLDCLSEDFVFYPSQDDVQNPELELPPEWYKANEQEMHENMFGDDSDVESISLVLTVSNIVYQEGIPEDETDDTCACVVDVDLRVNLVGDVILLVTGQSEFHLQIDVDQQGPAPDYERLWEIYQWYDLDSGGRGDWSSTEESSSWGTIKSLYW